MSKSNNALDNLKADYAPDGAYWKSLESFTASEEELQARDEAELLEWEASLTDEERDQLFNSKS